jgi:hypothetical protein
MKLENRLGINYLVLIITFFLGLFMMMYNFEEFTLMEIIIVKLAGLIFMAYTLKRLKDEIQ